MLLEILATVAVKLEQCHGPIDRRWALGLEAAVGSMNDPLGAAAAMSAVNQLLINLGLDCPIPKGFGDNSRKCPNLGRLEFGRGGDGDARTRLSGMAEVQWVQPRGANARARCEV